MLWILFISSFAFFAVRNIGAVDGGRMIIGKTNAKIYAGIGYVDPIQGYWPEEPDVPRDARMIVTDHIECVTLCAEKWKGTCKAVNFHTPTRQCTFLRNGLRRAVADHENVVQDPDFMHIYLQIRDFDHHKDRAVALEPFPDWLIRPSGLTAIFAEKMWDGTYVQIYEGFHMEPEIDVLTAKDLDEEYCVKLCVTNYKKCRAVDYNSVTETCTFRPIGITFGRPAAKGVTLSVSTKNKNKYKHISVITQ